HTAVPINYRMPTGGDSSALFDRQCAFGSGHVHGANFAFADGHVRFLKESTRPTILQALSTRRGGGGGSAGGYLRRSGPERLIRSSVARLNRGAEPRVAAVKLDLASDRRTKAAGGVLTAKQAPHPPGIAPALGLRAGIDVGIIVLRGPPAEGNSVHRGG